MKKENLQSSAEGNKSENLSEKDLKEQSSPVEKRNIEELGSDFGDGEAEDEDVNGDDDSDGYDGYDYGAEDDGNEDDGEEDDGDEEDEDDGDEDDGDEDTGDGIVDGDIVVIDNEGNEYILEPGGTYVLDNGQTVTINSDGSVQNVTLQEVSITSTVNVSTGEIALEAITLGSDIQSTTFSGIQAATEGIEVLESFESGFTIASIIASGLPAALNIIRDLYNGNEISLKDAVSLFFAVLAALGLYFGVSEFISFLLSLGATIYDVMGMY